MKNLLLLLLLVGVGAPAQPAPRPVPATVQWLVDRLWVREATGRNDGPAVAALVKAGGGNPADRPEWCGFTQAADQRAHRLPIPPHGMQGAARAWFYAASPRTCYLAGRRGALADIAPGDLVGFAYGRDPVVHHIARDQAVVPSDQKSRPPRGFWVLAGNEGRGPNAGLHLSYYPGPNIAAASRWDR